MAAQLLVDGLCGSVDTGNLAEIQGGIVTNCATFQTVLQVNEVCVDSGSINFLTGIIPIATNGNCPAAPTTTASYVDSKGRVIVFADAEYIIDTTTYLGKARYVFTPIENGCSFRLTDYSFRDINCLPAVP